MTTVNLETTFSDDDVELGYSRLTYKDYLDQCQTNGVTSSFVETLKKLDDDSVIQYLKFEERKAMEGKNSSAHWQNLIQTEALGRMMK